MLPPLIVERKHMVLLNNRVGPPFRSKDSQGVQMNNNGRFDMNITESHRPLVIQPLISGHTFVVTSTLMQMLTARGLFPLFLVEDPHAHIDKLNFVFKSCIGRPYWDINVIWLRVFPEMLQYGSMSCLTTLLIH